MADNVMNRKTPSQITDLILDTIPYPVLMLDGNDIIAYINLAGESFFCSSRSLLCGHPIENFLPFGSPVLDMLVRVRRHMTAIQEYKLDLSSPRIDQEAVVDIFVVPVPEMHMSEVRGHIIMIFQKRAVTDKIDRQLTHRDAARTVTGLASMLAHEIKNPLSSIRGAAQLLESNVDADDQSLTQLIREETDRIVKLVDRMEIFSDDRLLKRNPVNIHSVLNHVKNLALNGFGKQVKFVENYDPSLPPVYANRDQLIQVFINLVKNSCEATEYMDGARIIMATAFRSGIRLSSPCNKEKISLPLEFSIADNGCGIAESVLGYALDPFVTTKLNGTGLGLALVSKIIGNHGGVIEIESCNPGTIVRIMMPAWEEPNKMESNDEK